MSHDLSTQAIEGAFQLTTMVGELPGVQLQMSANQTGEELAELFHQNPTLPGVILILDDGVPVGLSQKEFLRRMARPYGLEVYSARPIAVMIDHAGIDMLQFSAAVTIEEAAAYCLARPAEQLYDPFLVIHDEEHEAEAYQLSLVDFHALMLALSNNATLRAQQMEAVLQTVPIGLLMLDQHFRVSPGYSAELERIFERGNLEGQFFPDILQGMLDEEKARQGMDYLGVLFREDLIDRLIRGINPLLEAQAFFPGAKGWETPSVKHLAFEFQRVRQPASIGQVLVMVEDRTRRVQLTEEFQKKQSLSERRLQLFRELIAVGKEDADRFLEELHIVLQDYADWSAQPDSDPLFITAFQRRLHAIKGEAGMLGLRLAQADLHRLEGLTGRLDSEEGALMVQQELETCLDFVRGGVNELRSLANSADKSEHQMRGDRTQFGLFANLERLHQQLRQRYQKSAQLVFHFVESDVPPAYRTLLRLAWSQLLRNAMAHGIEAPDQRLKAEKPAEATIQIGLRKVDDWLEFVFQDDGAGLNGKKIAEALGESEPDDRQTLYQWVFRPGLSTKSDDPDVDAGRGMGLEMILSEVQSYGGHLTVYDEPGQWCAFQILLPQNVEVLA
ncbi:MAG: ATP-binding protein [Verrucomicrobiales bacterium]